MDISDMMRIEEKLRNEAEQWRKNRQCSKTVEQDLLDSAIAKGFLLVGSRYELASGKFLIKKQNGSNENCITATDDPFVAKVNALICNYKSDTSYGGVFGRDIRKKKVVIGQLQDYTIAPQGYIYVVKKDQFKNNPPGSREYICDKPSSFECSTPFSIEEFMYPIIMIKKHRPVALHDPEGVYGQKIIYTANTITNKQFFSFHR